MKAKQLAGEKAVEFIQEGMSIGLGTGSTVKYTILKLAGLIKEGFKTGHIVSTSMQTTELANSLGIKLVKMNEVDCVDITIDGADEVDPYFNGIKGGGGALLMEKIVASNSSKNIWVVDASKAVSYLGKFPLPVEVVIFGARQVINKLQKLGFSPKLRMVEGKPFITDCGNYIVDCYLDRIDDAFRIQRDLNTIPGIVESGLFLGVVDTVIKANEDDVEVFHKTDIKNW